jgi:ATP-dependent DNA ligase
MSARSRGSSGRAINLNITAAETLFEECVWVQPETVVRIEYLEWTESDHLRHSKFTGIRQDKHARSVIKEHGGGG